ncbi:sensor histidine kinase [Oceanibacterium hippocampi]|uniref:histidine kinase n=1 Tax=Oceanibacterium hippocampi TaxID=745714 RepID=A0A1Y5TFW1_9PROT|nr:ATP-binding protein [Oceanibacterium hippocampi]SLN62801.1 Sensor protein QseC [Oceanibacterium hippocampi]
MSERRSLQRRLALGLAFGVALLWLVAAIGAGLVVRHELDEALDSALQETAQRLLPLAVPAILERGMTGLPHEAIAMRAHREFLTYLVRDPAGRVLLKSHDADPAHFPAVPRAGFSTTATHRLYGEAGVSGTMILEVAEPLADRRRAIMEPLVPLLLPLLAFIPLSLGGVWWFVRHSLRPVAAFNAEVERRGGGDLTPVADDTLPAELRPIAEAINRLIARLGAAIEAERSFTANSAHEIRTPIAAALAQTQRLIAEVEPGPLGPRARRIERSLHDLATLSEKLLQLAKAEGVGLVREEPGDLAPVLAFLVDEMRRAENAGERLRVHKSDDQLVSRIDPDAFAILLRNLIENALKHGDPAAPVDIVVAAGGVLRVVNAGPVVPAAQLGRLKDRFERAGTGANGAGLGLAIAEAIAAGAGCRLELFSPAPGRDDGFEARLLLGGGSA